jgi:hypothetical protein
MSPDNQVSCQIRIHIDAKLSFVLPCALANKLNAASLVETVIRSMKLNDSAAVLMNTYRVMEKYLVLTSITLARSRG